MVVALVAFAGVVVNLVVVGAAVVVAARVVEAGYASPSSRQMPEACLGSTAHTCLLARHTGLRPSVTAPQAS